VVTVLALFPSQSPREDLEPATDLFAADGAPEPYYLAVRAALVEEHSWRQCQVLAIPSFVPEWCVYLLPNEGGSEVRPAIVFKRPRKSIYYEMNRVLEEASTDGNHSFGPEAQAKAISMLDIQVERFEVPVSAPTADLLDRIWWTMLSRARHYESENNGVDGVQYHVAHSRGGFGYRSAETWSPDEGTRAAALVEIAESMASLAEAPVAERAAREGALMDKARALAKRLEWLAAFDQGR
jgi:hypothetical protein